MLVRLLVSADGEFRDVRPNRLVGHFEHSIGAASTPLLPAIEAHCCSVRYKVGFPDPVVVELTATREIVLLIQEAALEHDRIAPDEFVISKETHDGRRTGHGDVPNRL